MSVATSTAPVALVYDPRYHTFESWAALMCELYAQQQLEYPTEKTDWKEWGAGLRGIDVFVNEAIPNPYLFDDWKIWAQELVGAVNPSVR